MSVRRSRRVRHPGAGWATHSSMAGVVAFDRLLWRVHWRHLERLPPPEAGPVIVAANHMSYMDAVLMARLVWDSGRAPRFLAKADLMRRPLVGSVLRATRQIPVYRGSTEAANALRDAATALDAGQTVVIYPEGTTTTDPGHWPLPGKTGIARLWRLRPDTPVIPVGHWGAQRHAGRERWRWVPRREFTALVGEPVDLSRYRGTSPDAPLREITDTVMAAVRALVAEVRCEPDPLVLHWPDEADRA